jgi:putative spermidine/putrescine transport system substrate-binding protein
VNTGLVPNYTTIFDFLKNQQYNSANGKMYGIPHGWGANLLMYNTAVVTPAPTSWGAVFDDASPYRGKIAVYDSPISIADGALYLMTAQPDLGITNPYALDRTQFDAVIALITRQRALVGERWSDFLTAEEAFTNGRVVLGMSWQVIVNGLTGATDPVSVAAVLPSEGATAWSDTWMISSKAKHPNCMYLWFDWITSPDVNAQVAEYFGEAPAQSLACARTAAKDHCAVYNADDAAFQSRLWFWRTPIKACLDGRGAKCVDFAEWTRAWDAIKR